MKTNQRTRIKFCGITNSVDAVSAARAGADAIGMVFYKPSARSIAPATAKAIVDEVNCFPFVTPVGLFVDESPATILQIAAESGLKVVQLHGTEKADDLSAIRNLSVIKSLKIDPATIRTELNYWRGQIADNKLHNLIGIILDTAGPEAGGTGNENNWDLISQLQADGAFEGLPPIILAGGLTVANVKEVISKIRPYAVDVSSGIEESKGKKSIQKMLAFALAVNAADVTC